MRDPNPASEVLKATAAPSVSRLKQRADFLRAAKGRRWHGKAFSLQALAVADGDPTLARVGFTVTKKVGGSVVRNRARRRLREALRLTPTLPVRAAYDYVLIARIEAIRLPFSILQTDLTRAIRSVHAEARPHGGSSPRPQAPPVGGPKATPPRELNRTKPRP